jgi:hypothetical protein
VSYSLKVKKKKKNRHKKGEPKKDVATFHLTDLGLTSDRPFKQNFIDVFRLLLYRPDFPEAYCIEIK